MLTTVPTDAIRNGDFTGLGVNIYDPNTGNANGTGRSIISCNGVQNKICSSRMDPAALAMIKLIPEPNIPNLQSQNYFASGNAQFNRNDVDAKINYVPTQKATIFGRYSISQSFIFDPPALGPAEGDATNGGQLGNAYSRIQNVGIGGSYTFSANMLVDGNVGYTRQRINAEALDINSNFGLDTLHIPGTNGPDPLQGGIPAFQITGYANLGNPNTGNPFLFRDNQYVSNGNLNWTRGKHGLRFGIEFNRSGINHFQPQGGAFQTARGSFQFNGNPTALSGGPAPGQFNSIAEFLLGIPSRAGQAIQNQDPNSLRWSQWAAYARDQWQMRSNLTVTYGLRWERYPFVTTDHGGARFLDPTTMNVLIGGHNGVPLDDGVKIGPGQFLPRVGVAWRPLEHTVVRAGYGISTDPNNWRFFRNAYPVVTISDFNGNGFAPAVSLNGTNATLAPYGTLPTGIPAIPFPDLSAGIVPLPGGVGTTTAEKDFRRGYTHSFNLTIGQEFAGFVTDVGYVGSRSIRPFANININPGPLGGGDNARLLNVAFNRTGSQRWFDINQLTPFGNGYYDSLQAKLIRKFKGSSFVAASYTFSKAIDFTDNEELNFLLFPFPAYAPKARGLASFDRTHNLRLYGAYELPFGKNQRWAQTGILSKIAGGWQTNWILSKLSGTPFTITAPNGGFLAAGSTETANQSGPVHIINSTPRAGCPTGDLSCSYFDPSVFSAPSGPVFGNVGRDTVRGPGFFNLDMSLFRNFKLTERFGLQCRAEAFGLTNTPHFNNPNAGFQNPGSGNFGAITSTRPGDPGSRTIWLAAKVIF